MFCKFNYIAYIAGEDRKEPIDLIFADYANIFQKNDHVGTGFDAEASLFDMYARYKNTLDTEENSLTKVVRVYRVLDFKTRKCKYYGTFLLDEKGEEDWIQKI